MMFIGQYRHNLDSKNRLIIPAKFREGLGESFVVTRGLDGCLSVYTDSQWDQMITRLAAIPSTKKEARMYMRELTGNAQPCTFDSQGRIQLPQFLIKTANITKSCVVVGVADHVEIWSDTRWDSYDELASGEFESVAETLTEFLQ